MEKLNLSILIITAAIASIAIGNVVPNMHVFAQTNQTSSNATSTTSKQHAPIISALHKAIDNLKKGDDKTAKKELLSIEKKLEKDPKGGSAEKHIEASLSAIKDKDFNGATMHAQGALGELTKQ